MNIKTADRLINLRKKYGYTQESLADALGISRQAVSKWERAEASPDTDNLILLAKLYKISLDELLNEENIEDTINESKSNEEYYGETISINNDGIHLIKEDEEIHLDNNGIRIKKNDKDLEINKPFKFGIHVDERNKTSDLVFAISSLVVTIAYIILGFGFSLWHPGWIVFLLVLIPSSIVDAIRKHKITEFNYVILVTAVYLFLGCVYNLWHPGWIIFISVPVFYIIGDIIDKK